MTHQLISVTSMPTLPATFTSRARHNARGGIYGGREFYIVFEQRPLTIEQAMKMALSQQKSVPHSDLQYLYVAYLFYRRSQNPHGPSSRPIYVASLEYGPTTRYQSPGFLGKLMGQESKPLEVFHTLFTASRRTNFGLLENCFTYETAFELLATTVAKQVGLSVKSFAMSGGIEEGHECKAIQ